MLISLFRAFSVPSFWLILNPKGYLYTEENIDRMLEERHISQKIRRAGGRTSNPKKRTSEDDLRLEKSLIKTIECNFRG